MTVPCGAPCPPARGSRPGRRGAHSKRALPAGQAEVADFRSPAAAPPDRARPHSPGEVGGRALEGLGPAALGAAWERVSGSCWAWPLEEEAGLPQSVR